MSVSWKHDNLKILYYKSHVIHLLPTMIFDKLLKLNVDIGRWDLKPQLFSLGVRVNHYIRSHFCRRKFHVMGIIMENQDNIRSAELMIY